MARPSRLLTVLLLAFGTACQPYHLPGGGFDDGPQIGENGISVPVPPPSLTDAPRQTVEIEGELRDTMPAPDTLVQLYIYNKAGDWESARTAKANPDGTFLFADMNAAELDLTNNCLEIFSESNEDGMGSPSFYVASIAEDDQTIITIQFFSGCIQ